MKGRPPKRKNLKKTAIGKAVLKCPPHIKGDARRKWNEIVSILKTNKTACEIDATALAYLVELHQIWADAQAELRRDGPTILVGDVRKRHPAASIASEAMRNLRPLLEAFGLTPQSRHRAGQTSIVQTDEERREAAEVDAILGR